jgi:heavy metal sensor kinase
MNPRSIRFRLIVWYAGVLLLVMLGFGAFTYANLQRFMTQVLRETVAHRAQQIGELLLSESANADDHYVGREIEARYAPEKNERFVRITRADGSVFYLSGVPNDKSFAPWEVPPWVTEAATSASHETKTSGGSRLLIATHRVHTKTGDYLIEVGASMAASQRVLHTLLMTLLAGLPVVLGLVIFGGYLLMKRALQPVQSLMLAAQEISLTHLGRRLPALESGDEIASLTVVLNQMIARIDESFQHTSRFTADASHELRTPLTIMRGELEAIILGRKLEPDLRDALASLLEEVERLVRIVEGLFALSRLDTGEAQTERVRFDIAKLAETTAEQMCLLAEEKHIGLVCETDECVEVEGDRARLKQVVVNLLDNAIKYTPENGKVSLSVKPHNGCALLEVADSGPGASEAAMPHLFERFYRADEARVRGIEGAGLGLSIVRSICAAHSGSVTATNTPTGCRFSVELPLARKI